jgi:hypothetical protein
MTSGQDVSDFLDILGLVKSYFSSFFGENKIKKSTIFFWCFSGRPEDQAICLFGGLLTKPDMPLSHSTKLVQQSLCTICLTDTRRDKAQRAHCTVKLGKDNSPSPTMDHLRIHHRDELGGNVTGS